MEKKTSEEWYTEDYKNKIGTIYDPDGWNRQNFQFSWYEELITFKEFEHRAMRSTGIWFLPEEIHNG